MGLPMVGCGSDVSSVIQAVCDGYKIWKFIDFEWVCVDYFDCLDDARDQYPDAHLGSLGTDIQLLTFDF